VYLVILDGVREHTDIPIEREMFLNPARRAQFESTVVRPLARRYKGNSTVFAFDVLNESNHEVDGPIGWNELRALVRDTAAAIHSEDRERLVSCSLIKANAKSLSLIKDRYADLGLDFYDMHQYGDDPDLPTIPEEELRKPVVLGEFGQAEGGGEEQQAAAAAKFLDQAHARGWGGALMWAFDFAGSPKEHRLMNADGGWRKAATVLKQFGDGSDRAPH
jgi:endo-1,4-beta-mannosidase